MLAEWARILETRDWRRVTANTERARQLRQASPITTLLPDATRQRIRSEVAALKRSRGGHAGAQT